LTAGRTHSADPNGKQQRLSTTDSTDSTDGYGNGQPQRRRPMTADGADTAQGGAEYCGAVFAVAVHSSFRTYHCLSAVVAVTIGAIGAIRGGKSRVSLGVGRMRLANWRRPAYIWG